MTAAGATAGGGAGGARGAQAARVARGDGGPAAAGEGQREHRMHGGLRNTSVWSRRRGDDRGGGATTAVGGEDDAKATACSGEGKPKIEVGDREHLAGNTLRHAQHLKK